MNVIQKAHREPVEDGQRLLLYAVDWATYEKFLEAVGERPLRLTYDRGRLELMAPSWNHEKWKHRLALVVEELTYEMNIEVQPGGSTTFKRRDQDRGLEPDECFYIQHEAVIRGLEAIDLTRDPPPDLAIEVDITRSSLDRQGIYAALGVPELWRFDGETLEVYRLATAGYERCAQSPTFPKLPLGELVEFLHQTAELGENSTKRAFLAWARARGLIGAAQVGGVPPTPPQQPSVGDGA